MQQAGSSRFLKNNLPLKISFVRHGCLKDISKTPYAYYSTYCIIHFLLSTLHHLSIFFFFNLLNQSLFDVTVMLPNTSVLDPQHSIISLYNIPRIFIYCLISTIICCVKRVYNISISGNLSCYSLSTSLLDKCLFFPLYKEMSLLTSVAKTQCVLKTLN